MRTIFMVTAIIISSQLSAQQQKTDTIPGKMDEVTLTASKYSVKTSETGKVVTVISRDDIEHAGSRDLAQVITELGGVFINGYNSNAGKEKNIYLRGARVDHTLITIDGVPVYDASGIGSNFDIRNIPIDNVDRIEILKGSQSTLYGSDAIAGVINIITRKGGTKPFSVSGTAHYGSFHTLRANAAISGHTKAFDYQVGYTHMDTDGFSEAKNLSSSSSYDKDGFRQNNVQANIGVQVTPRLRVMPFFRYNHNSASLDQDAFVDELDFTNETKNTQTGIRNIFSFGKSQLHALYQYNYTDRNYLDDSTKSRNGFYTYNQATFKAKEHFGETFIIHPFSSFKLTAGADIRSSHTDFQPVQVPFPSQPFSGDSVKQRQVGVYAAINFSKRGWNIEGGSRFNDHSAYGSNFAFNFNPSYQLWDRMKIFANASTGYKTPSLYQLFSEYGNRNLEPENSFNLEGGLQFIAIDQKSSFKAIYFRRKVKDVIAFYFNPVTFQSFYINQDKQKDDGFELEGSIRIKDVIQLRAMYHYVDGKVSTLQNGKDTTYFNLLRRPKGSFTFFIGTQLTKLLYSNLQLTSVGKRKDIYFDPVTFKANNISLDRYTLVNFYAEYALLKKRLKIFADLRNITGKDYSDIYGYNTAGFNGYGGFRFQL